MKHEEIKSFPGIQGLQFSFVRKLLEDIFANKGVNQEGRSNTEERLIALRGFIQFRRKTKRISRLTVKRCPESKPCWSREIFHRILRVMFPGGKKNETNRLSNMLDHIERSFMNSGRVFDDKLVISMFFKTKQTTRQILMPRENRVLQEKNNMLYGSVINNILLCNN